ncbi:DUF2865 domain-containing protein [Hoeflea olei]|uniref:DUF2865 domain-containing protein n=1 Tax=Hoeflea olei TaxID=1480615 RepID=A0A1C1YWW9_9HYPH|nr:DUF2865 domain-containing protein [Hoeflea olei]OCW57975.1 hypothetical protein AWJ14_04095 [Hoeflea olei]
MRRAGLSRCVLLIALALAGAGPASAAATCAQLEAQLADITQNSEASANYRRFATAADKQERELGQVESDMKRFGCTSGSIIVVGGRNAEACSKLTTAHRKMLVNLAALERKRDSYSRRSDKVTARRLQAAIKANDCDGKRASVVAAALKGRQDAARAKHNRSPGLVAVLGDSGGRAELRPGTSLTRSNILVEPQAANGGGYRTLCVRSCDGFFFPVSSRAMPSDFARDERTCQMMCPGTPTELYFHSAEGQESADMVSARTRQPYSDMPNAFVYRNADAPMSKACGCNMSAFYKEMERREAILKGEAEPEDAPVTTWVHPSPRPDPGEDPETLLDSETQLSDADVKAVLSASQEERPLDQEQRQVRIVGPTFLPDASEHLDLKSGTDRLIR